MGPGHWKEEGAGSVPGGWAQGPARAPWPGAGLGPQTRVRRRVPGANRSGTALTASGAEPPPHHVIPGKAGPGRERCGGSREDHGLPRGAQSPALRCAARSAERHRVPGTWGTVSGTPGGQQAGW